MWIGTFEEFEYEHGERVREGAVLASEFPVLEVIDASDFDSPLFHIQARTLANPLSSSYPEHVIVSQDFVTREDAIEALDKMLQRVSR